MYISKTDIEDRALLNGMPFHQPVNPIDDTSDNFMEAAEEQLIEEHIWAIYELYEEAVEALNDQYTDFVQEIAWKLLSGMGPDDECVTDRAGEFFYREWEIMFYGNAGWRFDHHDGRKNFWDISLMNGLLACDDFDNDLVYMIDHYGRDANLNELQRAMLDIALFKYTNLLLSRWEHK